MIVLIVALLSTRIPILLGHDFLIFNLPHINRHGFRSTQYESRVDLRMLLACVCLFPGMIMSSRACRSGLAWFVV